MLKFWNSESLQPTTEKNSYVVYQDDDMPHKFYVAPNKPSIAINNESKLSFIFRKYRFSSDRTLNQQELERRKAKGLGGGYLIFDVVLRVPEQSQTEILEQLKSRYRKRLAKAAEAKKTWDDNPRPADKKMTADEQAKDDRLKQAYELALKNTDGVLDPDQVQIAAVPFTDGRVMLNIGKDADAIKNSVFVDSVVTLGKPAQDGSNTASFSVELSVDGAAFFEQAMNTGSGGAVQVYYVLKTWFRSADTVVTASYHKDNALKYDQTIKDEVGKTVWHEGSYSNKIDATLQKHEVVDISVKWADGNYDADQQSQIRKWAFDAVADAVKRQLNDFTIPEDKGSVARGSAFAGGTTERHYDLKATSDFMQTYHESFAMLIELNPQGMLPNVASINDPQNPGKKFQWSDYYSEVDLDDPFFKTLRLGVATDLDFTGSSVSRLDVELWYKDKKESHTTLTFTKDTPGRQQWDPFGTSQTYEYQYTVHFKQGPAYKSPRYTDTTKELVVGSYTDGIVAVDVIANGFAATTIRECAVALTVVDPTTRKRGPSTTVVLDNKQLSTKVVLPVGNDFSPPYYYEYTRAYALAPDNKKLALAVANGGGPQLLIPDPFPDYRTMNLRALQLKTGDSVFVQLEYREGDYVRATSKTLDSDNPQAQWTFGIYNRAAGTVTYQGSIDLKDGTSLAIAKTTARGDLIPISANQADDTTLNVTIDPSQMDWDTLGLQIVEVELKYGSKRKNVIFRTGQLPPEAPQRSWDLMDGETTYTWQAIYHKKVNGKTTQEETQPQTSERPLLVVPNPGDVPMKTASAR